MKSTSPKSRKTRSGAKATPAARETLVLSSNLTIYEAGSLKEELLKLTAQSGAIDLDLSGVAEIDTAGMQLLLLAQRESGKQGTTLRIGCCSPAVQDLIDLYDLAGLFGMAKAPTAPVTIQR